MHLPTIVSDLAIILLTGGVVTVIFKRINQPLVLGYIAAGFVLSPLVPQIYVSDPTAVKAWSEVGIIILMFALGLEFNLPAMAKIGGAVTVTTLTLVSGTLLAGFLAARAMGWAVMDSLFLGGILSMNATTIVIKTMEEHGLGHGEFSRVIFGTLVAEDIVGIGLVMVLTAVSASREAAGWALAMQLGMQLLYLVLWLLVGIYLLPTLLNRISGYMNDEMLLLMSLGVCFGMVLLSDALGYSVALGAFLAGALLAGTVHAERIVALTAGVRDLFGAILHISVGMMLEPAMVVKYIVPILIITAVTLLGKLLFAALGLTLAGRPLREAVRGGCALSQVGEFAFIIASLGLTLGVMAESLYPIVVSVSVFTTLLTPLLIGWADKLSAGIERCLPPALRARLTAGAPARRPAGKRPGDWRALAREYALTLALYGALLLGLGVFGGWELEGALESLRLNTHPGRIAALTLLYIVFALFVRPLLNLRSPHFTRLWNRGGKNRAALAALTGVKLLVLAFAAALPLYKTAGLRGLWLLPPILAALLLASRSKRAASVYHMLKTRFRANLHERELLDFADSDRVGEWLDERLRVDTLRWDGTGSSTLRQFGWGHRFHVDVFRIARGAETINMPSGGVSPAYGDELYLIGEAEHLRTFRESLGMAHPPVLPSLREYMAGEDEESGGLCIRVIETRRGGGLAGATIRESDIRDRYDCMILGLQRSGLPIAHPDVDMVIQPGDLVWVLGTREREEQALGETAQTAAATK